MSEASFLRSWFRRTPKRLLCRLNLETLEDRCVPAGTVTATTLVDQPVAGANVGTPNEA